METHGQEHLEVIVRETPGISLRSPLFIAGFAGPGLVGSISAGHVVQSLKMKEVAYVKSRYLPPAAVFEGGRLRHPFTIYSSANGRVCVGVCELPLRSDGLYQVAAALLDWAEGKKAREVVVLDGLGVSGVPQKYKTFFAAEKGKCDYLKKQGLEMLERGIIVGLAGCILNECLSRNISGTALLVPATAALPDPGAAATALESLNRLYKLKVDVSELKTQEEKVRGRLKELADKYNKLKRLEKKRDVPENIYA